MKPEFHKTVNVLVQAYLNDELKHGTCTQCAVGNIVEASYGEFSAAAPFQDGTCGYGWPNVFCTETSSREQRIFPRHYDGPAKIQIDSTGYTWQELAKVEHAFETAPYGYDKEEYMFNGLMAVVDVLADIHSVDLSVREDAKLLFAKP